MTVVVTTIVQATPLERIPTYIVSCCREWIAPIGATAGRCGLCGEVPTYCRPDDGAQP